MIQVVGGLVVDSVNQQRQRVARGAHHAHGAAVLARVGVARKERAAQAFPHPFEQLGLQRLAVLLVEQILRIHVPVGVQQALDEPGQHGHVSGADPGEDVLNGFNQLPQIQAEHVENPLLVVEDCVLRQRQGQQRPILVEGVGHGLHAQADGVQRPPELPVVLLEARGPKRPGQKLGELGVVRARHHGAVHGEPEGPPLLQAHAALFIEPPGQVVQQGGVGVHAALVVEHGGRAHAGHVVQIPGELRLLIAMGLAHAAELGLGLVAQLPAGVLRALHQHLTGLALDVAHGLVDGAIVVHVGVVGHHGAGHAVGELVGQHVQALGQVVALAGQEDLPAQIAAHVGRVVNRFVVDVAEVVQDQDRSVQAVAAGPADRLIIIVGLAVVVQAEQAHLIPLQIVRAGFQHHAVAAVEELPAVRHDDAPLQVAQVVHAGALVPHHGDGDLLFAAGGEIHIAGVVHALHELEHIAGVKAAGSRRVPRHDGGQAVQVFAGRGHVMGQVGQIRGLGLAAVRVVGVHHPHVAAALFFLGFDVHLQGQGQNHPVRVPVQQVQLQTAGLFAVSQHDPLRLLGGNGRLRHALRQVGDDAAGEAQHVPRSVGDDLHGPAQHGGVVVHLLEHEIAVSKGVGQRAPGLQLGALVAAQLLQRVVHHPLGVLKARDGAVGAGAVDQRHPPVVGIDPCARLRSLRRLGHRSPAQQQAQRQPHAQNPLRLLHLCLPFRSVFLRLSL